MSGEPHMFGSLVSSILLTESVHVTNNQGDFMIRRMLGVATGVAIAGGIAAMSAGTATADTTTDREFGVDGVRITGYHETGQDSTIFTVRYLVARDQSAGSRMCPSDWTVPNEAPAKRVSDQNW